MNYTQAGLAAKRKMLYAKGPKWSRKIGLIAIKLMLVAFLGLGIVGAALGLGVFRGIVSSTPRISLDALVPSGQATLIYDSTGQEVDKYVSNNSNRTNVTMDQVSQTLAQCFVAIEDERFYQHNGIDVQGMFRAAYQFLKTKGQESQGASTITQQLIKNAIFTDWTSEGDNFVKKAKRKLQEQMLAIEVTKNTTKDQVLLAYMNTINLGQNTLGVEAASLRYFGKSCIDLNLSESAVLASITQNPSRYNPISNPEANAKRRKSCLNKMLELGYATQAQYDEAVTDSEAVYARISQHNASYQESAQSRGTYFSDTLQKQVLQDLITLGGYSESAASNMLMSGGLRIYSTQDPALQAIADEEFANPDNYPENTRWYLSYALTVTDASGEVHNYSKENMTNFFVDLGDRNFNLIFSSQEEAMEAIDTFRTAMAGEGSTYEESISMTPQPQASFSLMDQHTGYVVALVGGRGIKEGRLTLNRASDTVRQPGSTFKVLAAYAPALDSAGMSLATTFLDAPFQYEDGRPVNNWYSGYRGVTTIRKAIEQSMNIIAVKTLTQITPQLGYDYLLNFGFSTLAYREEIGGEIYSDIQQSLSLGGITHGVTNLELNAAYASIANGGAYNPPKLYTKVTDSQGNILLDNTAPVSKQVIKPTTAFLLTSAMEDVVTQGTGGAVRFAGMSIAGKTGTTTSNKDVWFAGYTPYYTATTWAGYDNNVTLNSRTGETNVAKRLWKAIMSRIHADLPNESFAIPSGIQRASVCAVSGKQAVEGLCPTLNSEFFAEGTIPEESCHIHYQGNICVYDGLPASDECPFKSSGTFELPFTEDASLQSGQLPSETPQASRCRHNAAFMADPNAHIYIEQQRAELEQRAAAAAAAAAVPASP